MNPFNDDDAVFNEEIDITYGSPHRKAYRHENGAQNRNHRKECIISLFSTPMMHGYEAQNNGNATPLSLVRRYDPPSPFLGALAKRNNMSPLSPKTWKKLNFKAQKPKYDETPIEVPFSQRYGTKNNACLLDFNDLDMIPLPSTHLFKLPKMEIELKIENRQNKDSTEDKRRNPSIDIESVHVSKTIFPEINANQGEKVGCNCRNSKCLKLYCECLRKGGYCDASCNCVDCENHHYSKVRDDKIKHIEKKNPSAFKPIVSIDDLETVKVHNKGCNCKKNNCLKNYCECHQFGVLCSINCKCLSCKNTQEHISSNSLRNVDDKRTVDLREGSG